MQYVHEVIGANNVVGPVFHNEPSIEMQPTMGGSAGHNMTKRATGKISPGGCLPRAIQKGELSN